jgi:spore coat protein I
LTDKPETETDLRKLAEKVLQGYHMTPEDLAVIQSGSIKTVWKFRCQNTFYCLKRLKQPLDKVLFSTNAQIYIKENGGNVPGIIPHQSGEPYAMHNGQLFAVYEWLEGKNLDFLYRDHLAPSLQGLAEFHLSSKGYVPKEGARISTKLGKWPGQYASMKNRLMAWKEAAFTRSGSQHIAYVNCLDAILDLSDQALSLLGQSAYKALTSETSPASVLCHQDYGKGNALLTDEGVYVIDLDGVTFDLPSRDLRKIIGKLAETSGRWDKKIIGDVLSSYCTVHPLSEEEKKVLYCDLYFPHWFFGLVKNQYDKQKDIKASEIERMTKLELSKASVLIELLERCSK